VGTKVGDRDGGRTVEKGEDAHVGLIVGADVGVPVSTKVGDRKSEGTVACTFYCSTPHAEVCPNLSDVPLGDLTVTVDVPVNHIHGTRKGGNDEYILGRM
jgi:hypothetical protein